MHHHQHIEKVSLASGLNPEIPVIWIAVYLGCHIGIQLVTWFARDMGCLHHCNHLLCSCEHKAWLDSYPGIENKQWSRYTEQRLEEDGLSPYLPWRRNLLSKRSTYDMDWAMHCSGHLAAWGNSMRIFPVLKCEHTHGRTHGKNQVSQIWRSYWEHSDNLRSKLSDVVCITRETEWRTLLVIVLFASHRVQLPMTWSCHNPQKLDW